MNHEIVAIILTVIDLVCTKWHISDCHVKEIILRLKSKWSEPYLEQTHSVEKVVTHNLTGTGASLSFLFAFTGHTSSLSHHITPAHSPWDIPNVQVEVNTLPMIQFIQGYFALK